MKKNPNLLCSGETPFGNAKYIKAQLSPSEFSYDDPLPLFRREFFLEEESLTNAELLLQSPGFAECRINGIPVTRDIFNSPISNYRSILWYTSYDVTKLLRPGKNVLSVIAGNGFFNESFKTAWDFDAATWRDAPQFLLSLRINGKECVVSDAAWKVDRASSPIRFSHLRCGEYYDARLASDAWRHADFDDSAWMNAIERDSEEVTGELRLCPCPPVRELESYAPTAITKTETGYLLDFGVNSAGYIGISVCEEEGTEILFRYAEEKDDEGNPKHNGMNGRHFYPNTPFQVNKMIASGGMDYFKPLFSYHGFRYVWIDGLKSAPTADSVKAYFIHNDLARTASFACGNEIINFIYNAGMRSTMSNMFWCLTDCPTREKLGWTNDAQATTEQVLINFDSVSFLTKWFEDIKSNLREDGALPGVVPTHGWGYDWGPVCDCLLYELPYRLYLYTGDATMLFGAIKTFEIYANSLEARLAAKVEFKLGDWLGHGSSKLVSKEFVNEFYLLKAFRVTDFAHRLAKTGVTEWGERYARAREEFINRYLDSENRCIFDHQAPLAMMLENGLWRDREALAEQLVSAVIRDECQLTCGMVGVQYLYDALAHCGRADLAFRMITESDPGYKTWFSHGASTLWERWDGENSGSHNHHMYSGVIAWFFKALLGIRPKESHPGFVEIDLCPSFVKEIGFVKGSEETVRGEIRAEWKYENGEFIYTVSIPEGICARFDGALLKSGENVFRIPETNL